MTAPQTVLFFSNHAAVKGGGEISLLGLLERMQTSQLWKPVLVVPEEGAVAVKSRASAVPTYAIPMPSLRQISPVILTSMMAIVRLVRTTGAQLIHANGSRVMLYAGIAGKVAHCPVVWHVRVTESDGFLDRVLYRMAARVIVNSQAVRQRFAWTHGEKIRCIHNGVDTIFFLPQHPSPEGRAFLGLAEDDRVVVSVGRFVTYKGYGDLLEAWRQVQHVVPQAKLVLVGDGDLRRDLEKLANTLGVASSVRFTGWVEDVRRILALSEMCVLPSHGEHFGRVLIEAMAMGKAVVATMAGGVPEIVLAHETGLLVPPADPPALAGAILGLLHHPSQAVKYGEAGRRRVEGHFSLDRHVQAVQHVYHELQGV